MTSVELTTLSGSSFSKEFRDETRVCLLETIIISLVSGSELVVGGGEGVEDSDEDNLLLDFLEGNSTVTFCSVASNLLREEDEGKGGEARGGKIIF